MLMGSKWKRSLLANFEPSPLNSDSIENIKDKIMEYKTRKLFADDGFTNGFTVLATKHAANGYNRLGDIGFPCSAGKPSWLIAQWHSKHCLWAERKGSDPYTITDGITKTVRYNPDDRSVFMQLNARNVYEGRAAGSELWPHLLLEQTPLFDREKISDEDRKFYDTDSDKMLLSLDIRCPEYGDTTNPEGINACQFLAYFYLTYKHSTGEAGKRFIWFGVGLFDSRGPIDTYWNGDSVGTEMIYSVSTAETYGSLDKSFSAPGHIMPDNDWHEIRLDLLPHIDRCLELANRDNTFGEQVTRDDFYFNGNNIGFEIHGNYNVAFEIKNYNITSYRKA